MTWECACGCGRLIGPDRQGRKPRYVSGHNMRGKTRPKEEPAVRFWRLVPDQPREGCWLWTGTPAGGRYGNFKTGRGRESTTAHRFAWELTYGPIPIGMFVCHRCDTPKCVRPDHLFLGTARENTRDMLEKGRHGNQWKTGVNR